MEHQELDAVVSSQLAFSAGIARAELWQAISRLAASEQERTVLIDNFVYDLPLATTLARHPHLFPDLRSVYMAKRDLLERFRQLR